MSQPKDSEKKNNPEKKKKNPSKTMEGRVEDYLYNPETKEKIEPPSEEEIKKQKPDSPKASPGKKSTRTKKKTAKKASDKKIVKKKLHPAAKIGIVAAKIVFLWIPLTLVSLIFVALIIVKAFLSPGRVEKLITENFNAMSNSTISLDVEKFNPYGGFVINNLAITQPVGFGTDNLVSIDRLVLDYGFFSIFTGDVSFREIGIYSPSIHLVQKDGVWNAASLMKPSDKKEPEKEEVEEEKEKDETQEPKESISLPVAVNLLFNFVLEDLNVRVDGEDFSTRLNSFDTSIAIDVPPTKEIPLGPKAVELIRTFAVKINPDRKLDVSFSSDVAAVSPPLLFSFDLLYSGEDEKNREFHSSFIAGTSGTPVRFQKTNLAPLSFTAGYNISFDPIVDELNIDSFNVRFAGNNWLDLGGKVSSVTSNPTIDIFMKESAIVLDALYPYFVALTEDDSTRFSGTISLHPLTVKGTPEDIKAAGALKISALSAALPDFGISVPEFSFDYDVHYANGDVDAATKLAIPGFSYKMGRERSGRNNVFLELNARTADSFSRFTVPKFSFQFNDPRSGQNALSLDLSAQARTGDTISAETSISQLVFRKYPLINMVPNSIGSSLQSIPLEKPVTMSMNAGYTGSGDTQAGNVQMGFRIPDYDVYDLKINTDAAFNTESKVATINQFRLWSNAFGVNVNSQGFLDTNPGQDSPFKNSDIRFSLAFTQDQLRRMYGPWQVGGRVRLNTRMRGDLKTGNVKGSLSIDHLNVRNDDPEMGLLLDVEDVNMEEFPFEYYFTSSFTGKSTIASDKSDVISNQFFVEKENFSIKSIRMAHPVRKKQQYEYLKDLKASMEFLNNAFTINRFKTTVMNGSVYLRDTFVYLADLNPDNMEYNLAFDATNIDIGKLDNPDKLTKESELSFTTRLSGKGFDFANNVTTEGNITIYKLGEKFARELMEGLSEKEGESKLGFSQNVVDHSKNLDRFNFYISNGSVYTTVKLDNKIIGHLVTIDETDEIKYERIPIQEFLSSVMGGDEQ